MPENELKISRVNRTKAEARASYNSMSSWYDTVAGIGEKAPRERGIQKLNAADGETVLEIGFGTGHGVLAIARAVGDNSIVYGIDISEGMLEITRTRLQKAGFLDGVVLQRGDAAVLPYENDFFDAIFMSFSLELFDTPEIPLILQECRRTLKENGRICVVAMVKKPDENLMTRLYEWSHSVMPRYVDCRPINIQGSLKTAGFAIVDVEEISMWGLPVEIVLAGLSWETSR